MVTTTPAGTYTQAQTYTQLSTKTLTAAAASVVFSSIPATYTDLVLEMWARSNTGTPYGNMYINGDTTSTGCQVTLFANSANASGGTASNDSSSLVYIGQNSYMDATNPVRTQINIFNYSRTSMHKNIFVRMGNVAEIEIQSATWRSTAAINQLDVRPSGNSWGIGSVFSLYGIKAAV